MNLFKIVQELDVANDFFKQNWEKLKKFFKISTFGY